jgi:hypothetical protein
MPTCVTCGAELHPERAKKYDYCMSPECQKKNLKGLTMVAVGVNKAAEQYLLLDEDTKAELARGKYHDQRRGSFGTSVSAPDDPSATGQPRGADGAAGAAGRAPAEAAQPRAAQARAARPKTARPQAARPRAARTGAATKAPQPWTPSQARLAILYNEQGMRPAEIAAKLGLSTYAVTQIILTARNRGKL